MNNVQNQLKLFRVNLSHFLLSLFFISFLTNATYAAGLQQAKGILETIKTEILGIVPIIAVIALICLCIGYMLNSVQKETFMRWGIGLVLIGSATQITNMLLK